MKATPTLCALGLLVSFALPFSATAAEVPAPGEEASRRPPQLAVEVGGSWSRMQHPTTYVPTSRALVRTVDARASAPRLSGGLHFNLLRGSDRSDFWWTNAVDWYLAGQDIQVLAFRPGLEKRFSLSKRLTLGVSAFGTAADVSVPTGQIMQGVPNDPNVPQTGSGFREARSNRWIFGAGGAGALNVHFGRVLYTRIQAGYTHYFKKAEDFQVNSDLDDFSVSLTGPWVGALVGVSL